MEEIYEISSLMKEELLSIYRAFAAVCEKYKLRHWVAYGTLLGAVRHHGFIPWDDDFDVMMPRDDYDKFLSLADQELPKWFKVVSYKNCEKYMNPFFKIQESRKSVYESLQKGNAYVSPQGCYIDVFPLDGEPVGTLRTLIDKSSYFYLWCKLVHHRAEDIPKNRIAKITYFIGMFFNSLNKKDLHNKILSSFDKRVTKYSFANAENVRVGCWHDRLRDSDVVFPKKSFDETIFLPYETFSVPVPKDYDTILKILYGDYMTPPPLGSRKPKHSVEKIAPWYYGPNSEA